MGDSFCEKVAHPEVGPVGLAAASVAVTQDDRVVIQQESLIATTTLPDLQAEVLRLTTHVASFRLVVHGSSLGYAAKLENA
jgi:uncharacterized protein YicC (UPF0701 family)